MAKKIITSASNPHDNNKGDKNTMNTTSRMTALLREYEKQANPETRTSDTEYAAALQNLARACTYSVLKKLCNVGGTVQPGQSTTDSADIPRQLRREMTKDFKALDNMRNANNTASHIVYDSNGNAINEITDKQAANAVNELIHDTLSDGIDLVQTAICAILDETNKQADRPDGLSAAAWLETPQEVRRLTKKVYIVGGKSPEWETVERAPIQNIFIAIRQEVASNRAVQVASHKYTYIADLLTDTDNNTEETIYKRLPAYSQLATWEMDYNGGKTVITAGHDALDAMELLEVIAERCKMSAQQVAIIKYRLSGYGRRAIANTLGVKPNNIQTQLYRIQSKLTAIGITADKLNIDK